MHVVALLSPTLLNTEKGQKHDTSANNIIRIRVDIS